MASQTAHKRGSVRADSAPVELCLYDEISVWSVRSIVEQIRSAPDAPVTLRINSPGGDVQEGFALANALRTHRGRKTAVVEGVCASAATFPLCACDEVQMHPESLLMIHCPWGGAGGTIEEIEKYTEVLKKMRDLMVGMYMRKTGKDEQAIRALMQSETWMTPAEAQAAGFCDLILDSAPLSARASARRFAARFAARLKLPIKSGARSPAKNKRNAMTEEMRDKLCKHGLAEDDSNMEQALAAYLSETEDGPAERKEMARAVEEMKEAAKAEHEEPDGDEGEGDKDKGEKKAVSRVASAMAAKLAEADAERKALAKQVAALEKEREHREVGEVVAEAKSRGLSEADAREFYKDFGKQGAMKWLAKFPRKVAAMGKWNVGGGEALAEGSAVEKINGVNVIGRGLAKAARDLLAKGEAKDISEAQRIAAKRSPHLYASE